MTTILDILDTVQPRLPERWVSKAALRRVRAAATKLPRGAVVCFLERRFSRRNARVDFGLCYPHHSHRALLNGNERLARGVPFLWLEVDCAAITRRVSPGILLCVDSKLGRAAFGRAVPSLTEKRLLTLGKEAHQQFLLEAAPSSVQDALRACFAALPASGRLLHLCFMPSRNPPVMKVNVSLPKRSLPGYLKAIAWPGSLSGLADVWRGIAPLMRTAKIDLTLSPSIGPKLGIEVHPFNTSVDGRRRVLAWLTNNGLAEARQCADLLAWHGSERTESAGTAARVELDFGMKIVLDASSKIEAKAYFQVASESLVPPALAAHKRRKFDV